MLTPNQQTSKLLNHGLFIDLADKLQFPDSFRPKLAQTMLSVAREFHGGELPNHILNIPYTIFSDMVGARGYDGPLYVAAKINGFDFQKATIEITSSANLMPLSTFNAACIPEKSLVPESVCIRGLMGQAKTLGHVTVGLQVGPIRSATRFHIIDTTWNSDIFLGRSWIDEFDVIVSTYHQCVKGRFQGKEVVIKPSQIPCES